MRAYGALDSAVFGTRSLLAQVDSHNIIDIDLGACSFYTLYTDLGPLMS